MSRDDDKVILLVEDEALIALAEARMLRQYGYKVITAYSGEEAIQTIKTGAKIDLVLMDINLEAGMDGTQAAERILQLRDLPLMFLSSHTERQVVEKIEGITSYGYIVKNSGETVLIASIKMAFRLLEARLKEKEKEEGLQITLNSIGDAVIATDANGRVTRMNPVAEKLTGWTQAEARNEPLDRVFNIVNSITRKPVENPVEEVILTGRKVGLANHTLLIARDGSEYQIADSAAPILDQYGKTKGVVLVFRDVTDEYRNAQALQESEEKYRKLFENAPVGIFRTNARGQALGVNKTMAQIVGVNTPEEAVAHYTDLGRQLYVRPERREEFIRLLREKGRVEDFEYEARTVDGRKIWLTMNAQMQAGDQGDLEIEGFTTDITARKEAEVERDTVIQLFNRLNQPNGMGGLMNDTINFLREWSGCQAVGVRLQEGEDYPYFETRGFPEKFVLREKYLCATKRDGELLRDSQGNAVLECMCGNVIRGRFNPALPFFTENGSFWTNSTTELLASTTEKDRQARTRNRCNGEGYESVALIPLRYGNQTLGLLQFNDQRRGMFTKKKIVLMEHLALNLAMGLAQRQTAEALRRSEEKYRLLVENQNDLVTQFDGNQRLQFASPTYCATFGISEADLLGRSFMPLIHEADRPQVLTSLQKALEPPYFSQHEERALTVNSWRWFAWSLKAVVGENGQVSSIVGVGRDITEQKLAEEALRKAYQEKQELFRELQHRAKNSFTMINSMTDLMAEASSTPEVQFALAEVASRTRAIAELYDLLYATDAVREVRLDDYCERISASLAYPSSRIGVTTAYEEMSVAVKVAAPLGLILTELITNAVKHAFPHGRQGTIRVSLRRIENQGVMEVEDDGVGLPENFNVAQCESLGLKLVQVLVAQIRGRWKVDSVGGTRVLVEFPV